MVSNVAVAKSAFMPVLALCVFLLIVSDSAFAEDRAQDRIDDRTPAAVGASGVSRKRYAGGADEDDLQVQATLPIPSRTLDGTSLVATPAAEAGAEGATPPSND